MKSFDTLPAWNEHQEKSKDIDQVIAETRQEVQHLHNEVNSSLEDQWTPIDYSEIRNNPYFFTEAEIISNNIATPDELSTISNKKVSTFKKYLSITTNTNNKRESRQRFTDNMRDMFGDQWIIQIWDEIIGNELIDNLDFDRNAYEISDCKIWIKKDPEWNLEQVLDRRSYRYVFRISKLVLTKK